LLFQKNILYKSTFMEAHDKVDKKDLWQAILGELEIEMTPSAFKTWFGETEIAETTKNSVTILVPAEFHKSQIQRNFEKDLLKIFNKLGSPVTKIEYRIGRRATDGRGLESLGFTKGTITKSPETVETQLPLNNRTAHNPERLNPNYVFDTFIVGDNNSLAFAAAKSAAEAPGLKHNPLFIYGGVGLGKTHLMQAIGNEVLATQPKKRVIYVTSEKFLTDLISSIRQGHGTQDFRDKYRRADVLLVDDIQFFGKTDTGQEEFFHTFNALHEAGRQIVLSSDRPPKAIATLEERLRSRFEWGMITDIKSPSYETRVAILKAKLENLNLEFPEEVIDHIARSIQDNIRELEGAINRIAAYCDLEKKEPTLKIAKELLASVFYGAGKKILQPEEVLERVASFYELRTQDLKGSRRLKEIVYPRQVCVYLLREEMGLPYKRIGEILGGRDHSTIMHDYKKIDKEILDNEMMSREVKNIKDKLYV